MSHMYAESILAAQARQREKRIGVLPAEFVCRAGPVMSQPFSKLSVTTEGTYWHDHSVANGDIVCTGPFALFGPREEIVAVEDDRD